MKKETYQISEAEKLTGEKAHVLRYWEEELGLCIGRNTMGHRIYTGQDIQIFLSIKELKKKGLHLKAIRDLLPKLREAAGQVAAQEEFPEIVVPAALVDEVQTAAEQEKPEEEIVLEPESSEIIEIFPSDPSENITAEQKEKIPEKEKKQTVILEMISGDSRKNRTKNLSVRGENVSHQKKKVQETEKTEEAENINETTDWKTEKKDGRKEQFYQILEKLMRQMLLKQRQEERYRRVDEAIRRHQQSRRESAATSEQQSRRKKKNRQNFPGWNQ